MSTIIIRSLILISFLLVGCGNAPQVPTIKTKPSVQQVIHTPVVNGILWRELSELTLLEATMKQRIIIIIFSTEDCNICKVMQETTFKDAEIVDLMNNNFVPVLLSGEKHAELLDTFGLDRKWPSMVLLSPSGSMLAGVQGYIPPDVFQKFLEKVVSKQKEKVDTTFSRNF